MPRTNLYQEITIEALPSKVWKVLTSLDYISQYLSETEIKNSTELESTPGISIKWRHIESAEGLSIVIIYELFPVTEGVVLKMKFDGLRDTEESFQIRNQNALIILQKIKWLAEYS